MTLHEQIKQDLTAAIKTKDTIKKDALRVVLGEFGRMDKKVFSDDEVIKVLMKLIKSEKELLEQSGQVSASSPFIDILNAYLPQQASDEEITSWIQANVDFSQFKNKMQAMGMIMKHFGAAADGNKVKAILMGL